MDMYQVARNSYVQYGVEYLNFHILLLSLLLRQLVSCVFFATINHILMPMEVSRILTQFRSHGDGKFN